MLDASGTYVADVDAAMTKMAAAKVAFETWMKLDGTTPNFVNSGFTAGVDTNSCNRSGVQVILEGGTINAAACELACSKL